MDNNKPETSLAPLPTGTDNMSPGNAGDPEFHPTNARLLRLLVVFQVRLLLDGLRDLLLSPISFFAVLLDLLSSASRRGQYFEMLCYWGQKSDQWINLFGLPEHGDESTQKPVAGVPGIDSLVDSLEKAVRDGSLRKENRAALRARVQKLIRNHLK